MEPQVNDVSKREHQETMSRRQLLKALIAAGGAVTASTVLPGKWSQPVVEVGVLPAHAQVTPMPSDTPTPVPTTYIINCDSLPGGGQIAGYIDDVAVDIDLYSGTGPLAGIQVTVTCNELPGTAFSPTLPQTVATNANGRASFGRIDVTGTTGTTFFLSFSCVDPVNGGPLTCLCGEYELL
ncbi:MAG: hypothetical protein PVF45_08675 [Anaerolineae bacterium]|jgi:hypothetical protein